MKLSQLHQDVITAINLVPRFVADRFDMRFIQHSCETPACAKGNINSLDRELGRRIWSNTRYTSSYDELFGQCLHVTIKTPADWRDHAIAWLKLKGVDYYEVTGTARVATLPSHAGETFNSSSVHQSDAAAYRAFRRKIEEVTA